MDNKTRKFFITGIIVVIAIISLIFFSFNLGGMFLLGTDLEDSPEDFYAQEINYEITPSDSQGLNLSYKVLEKTILNTDAKEISAKKCPDESEVSFLIKNTGQFELARSRVIFPKEIRIFFCNNCNIEDLKMGEEINVTARICKASEAEEKIRVVSSNADDLFININ